MAPHSCVKFALGGQKLGLKTDQEAWLFLVDVMVQYSSSSECNEGMRNNLRT